MSDRTRSVVAPACRAGVGGRALRGVVAILLAAFAVSSFPAEPLIGAAVGFCAVVVTVMAVTGRCPADWFASRGQGSTTNNTFGFPDVHEHINLSQRATIETGDRVDWP